MRKLVWISSLSHRRWAVEAPCLYSRTDCGGSNCDMLQLLQHSGRFRSTVGIIIPTRNQWESVSDGPSQKANNLQRTDHPILKIILSLNTSIKTASNWCWDGHRTCSFKVPQGNSDCSSWCSVNPKPCTVGWPSPMFPWFPWCPSVQSSPVSAPIVLQLSHFSPVWKHSNCSRTPLSEECYINSKHPNVGMLAEGGRSMVVQQPSFNRLTLDSRTDETALCPPAFVSFLFDWSSICDLFPLMFPPSLSPNHCRVLTYYATHKVFYN